MFLYTGTPASAQEFSAAKGTISPNVVLPVKQLHQIVKAFPKALKQVSDEKLKETMTAHLQEISGQVTRLRTIFEHLGKKPTGKHRDGTGGCLKEVEEAV